ncbi:FecR family protein [Sphingobacterium lactis]|uniref:FecR family protein n=1 Tax=Sphingobacterium TaxID=28453 RepID=UPI0021A9661B|nr:FecR domain-containing protein [Sphingobacterium hotanense]MCT1525314.1 FecR domain-containing protein [Sphingobacterium hotanense]
MDENRRKELLKKFKKGTLTLEDKRELWGVNEGGEIDYPFDDGAPDPEIYENVEMTPETYAALDRILVHQTHLVRKERKLRNMYRVAASMAAVFLLYFGFTKVSDRLFLNDNITYVTVEVSKGMVRSVTLPDGSVATVSPGSVLRYPETFNDDERKIFLDKGEAFFEVAKNPDRPFRVQAGELQTTALGTSFTVQYDPVMKREKVNLYTGKVSVKTMAENTDVSPIILSPGNAYEYKAGKVTLSEFNAESSNPVIKGLVFNEVPLEEAMYRIGSWYGISLVFDKENTDKHWINGNFNNKEIEDILFILSNTYDLEFTKTDSLTYKIERK